MQSWRSPLFKSLRSLLWSNYMVVIYEGRSWRRRTVIWTNIFALLHSFEAQFVVELVTNCYPLSLGRGFDTAGCSMTCRASSVRGCLQPTSLLRSYTLACMSLLDKRLLHLCRGFRDGPKHCRYDIITNLARQRRYRGPFESYLEGDLYLVDWRSRQQRWNVQIKLINIFSIRSGYACGI